MLRLLAAHVGPGQAGQAGQAGQGWIGSWSPGIGDPTFIGWLTVVGYFASAYLCWRAYRKLRPSAGVDAIGGRSELGTSMAALALAFLGARARLHELSPEQRQRALWLGLAVILLLLGINKQLDLQSALTETGRIASRAYGWYAVRQPVQVAFIVAVALFGLVTFRAVLLLAGGDRRGLRAALIGTLFLICFVTIRAVSFHHIDRLLGSELAGFRMNWLIELGGILFIAAGACRSTRIG
jgi:hypothetical protein